MQDNFNRNTGRLESCLTRSFSAYGLERTYLEQILKVCNKIAEYPRSTFHFISSIRQWNFFLEGNFFEVGTFSLRAFECKAEGQEYLNY